MIELISSRLGIAGIAVLVVMSMLGVAGCREDRLNRRIDQLTADNRSLTVDLGICKAELTLAEGGRAVLADAFKALREKAIADSSAAALVARQGQREVNGLRRRLAELVSQARSDTTTWDWRDLWF